MKKNVQIGILGASLLLLVLLGTSSLLLFPYLHDRTLHSFSSELMSLPLPENTKKNDSLSAIGQQSGNGDHCDYLAVLMLHTNLSKDAAESFYKQKYTGAQKLKFLWGDELDAYASPSNDITGIHPIQDWIRGRSKDDTTNLIVYIYEPGMTSSWDYRCN